MDRKMMRICSLFLAILLLSSATLARAVGINTALVSAVVTDAETGSPVANAVVHLTWIAHPSCSEGFNVLLSGLGALSLELVTDRAGRFLAKSTTLSLPKGYEITRALDPVITIYASGYRRARFTATALAGNALMIEPLSGETDSKLALERELALAGRHRSETRSQKLGQRQSCASQ